MTKFWKNKHYSCKKHVVMYPCTKFQLKTTNFGSKFVQKNMTEKYFEKINIKIVISI